MSSARQTEEWTAWIGREQRITQTLHPFAARAMAALLNHNRLPDAGDPLPAAWHWLYFLETPSSVGTGPDGHADKGAFMPPIVLPRRMWAAGALAMSTPLRLGEPAEKISTIRNVEHKQGKSGELYFLTLEHELRQGGLLCIQEQQTIVYRAMPTEHVPLPPGPAAHSGANWSRTLQIDPVLLFRFSALTYNAHRIHYDRDYATRIEGYPGLVVHGPLLMLLLLELLRTHLPEPGVKSVRFRALHPTFDLAAFSLHGRHEGALVTLWSTDADNLMGMSATAALREDG